MASFEGWLKIALRGTGAFRILGIGLGKMSCFVSVRLIILDRLGFEGDRL